MDEKELELLIKKENKELKKKLKKKKKEKDNDDEFLNDVIDYELIDD